MSHEIIVGGGTTFIVDGFVMEAYESAYKNIRSLLNEFGGDCIEFSDEEIPGAFEANRGSLVLNAVGKFAATCQYNGYIFKACVHGMIDLFGKVPQKIYFKPFKLSEN